MFKKIGYLICAIGLTTSIPTAMAEPHRQCERPYIKYADSYRNLQSSLTRHIRSALDELTPDTLTADLDRPTQRRDDFLVEKRIKQTNYQRLVARRMEREFCTIIYARLGPDDVKLEKYNTVRSQVWRAGSSYSTVHVRRGERRTAALWLEQPRQDGFRFMLAADPKGQISIPDPNPDRDPETEESDSRFVAPVPFIINDTNKHFVIIASRTSVASGIRAIDEFAVKLPHMDFALYDRYWKEDGTRSKWYGVMLATWVSRDVAAEALKIAREELGVSDAYCWRYPDGGNECPSGTTATEDGQSLSQHTLLTLAQPARP